MATTTRKEPWPRLKRSPHQRIRPAPLSTQSQSLKLLVRNGMSVPPACKRKPQRLRARSISLKTILYPGFYKLRMGRRWFFSTPTIHRRSSLREAHSKSGPFSIRDSKTMNSTSARSIFLWNHRTIANKEPPDEEVLVDRPEVENGITCVSGPFCVEATCQSTTKPKQGRNR